MNRHFLLSLVLVLSPAPGAADPWCRPGPSGTLSAARIRVAASPGAEPAALAWTEADLERPPAVRVREAAAGDDGGVPLPPGPGTAFLVFEIDVPEALPARVTLGAPIPASLRLDGRLVDLVGEGADPDAAWADVDLAPGRHRLVVRCPIERKAAVRLRLLDRGNAPAPVRHRAVGLAPEQGCLAGARVLPDLDPSPEGFRGSVRVAWPDRRPDAGPVVTVTAGAATVTLPVDALARETRVPVDLHLAAGPRRLRVVAAVSDGTVPLPGVDLPVRFRPGPSKDLAALRAVLATVRDLAPFARASLEALAEDLATALATDDAVMAPVLAGDARALAARVLAGKSPYGNRTGIVRRAYRSAQDGRLQRFVVRVPHRRNNPLPLVLALHGQDFGPVLTLRQILGADRDEKTESLREAERRPPPALPEVPFLIATPPGHGNSGWKFFAEDDLDAIVEALASEYPVDRDRVHLAGVSLGGMGIFQVGLRRPDRFASAAPVAGYGSLTLGSDVRGKPRAPWEDVLVDRNDNALLAVNGLHLPLWVAHGTADFPRNSRVVTDRYRELGYRVAYQEWPVGHEVWREAWADRAVFDFFARHRRDPRPRRVAFRAATWADRQAWWVRVDAPADRLAAATVRGEVHDAPDGCRVEVATEGAAAWTLLRDRLPAACAGALHVVLDGVRLSPGDGDAGFVRDGGTWRLRDPGEPPPAPPPGPVEEAWYGPLLFVYGTQDPAQTATNRERALADARGDAFRADVAFPVKADTDVTPDDLRSRNLVLYGNPRSNAVLARFAAALPVRFDDDAIVVEGRRHAGPEVGIVLAAPSPGGPGRFVVVKAGVGWRGTLLSRHLPLLLPDFVVYDQRVAVQTGGKLMDRRPWLDGGWWGRAP